MMFSMNLADLDQKI